MKTACSVLWSLDSVDEYRRIGEKEKEPWFCPRCLACELPFIDDNLSISGDELELDDAEARFCSCRHNGTYANRPVGEMAQHRC